MERIEIKQDGDCFRGVPFFIQAALFEKSGNMDWNIELLKRVSANHTGMIHEYYFAWKLIATSSKVVNGERIDKYTEVEAIPKFEIYANGYSYQKVFKQIMENIKRPRMVYISDADCRDERAIPTILIDNYLFKINDYKEHKWLCEY